MKVRFVGRHEIEINIILTIIRTKSFFLTGLPYYKQLSEFHRSDEQNITTAIYFFKREYIFFVSLYQTQIPNELP